MSTSSTLKLALELAAKVTGREDIAALAGEVQQLGPISDETAAETARLAQTLETLSQQQALIQQFNQSADALTQLELSSVLSRDKLAQLRAEQQAGTGQARVLTDQERMLASEVKQLERQLVALAKTMPRRTQTIALPLLADTASSCRGRCSRWAIGQKAFYQAGAITGPAVDSLAFYPSLNGFRTGWFPGR